MKNHPLYGRLRAAGCPEPLGRLVAFNQKLLSMHAACQKPVRRDEKSRVLFVTVYCEVTCIENANPTHEGANRFRPRPLAPEIVRATNDCRFPAPASRH